MSRLGRLAHSPSSEVRLRNEARVMRFFNRRPGERLTVDEALEGIGGMRAADLRVVLRRLADAGWLRWDHGADHRTVYWREAADV